MLCITKYENRSVYSELQQTTTGSFSAAMLERPQNTRLRLGRQASIRPKAMSLRPNITVGMSNSRTAEFCTLYRSSVVDLAKSARRQH